MKRFIFLFLITILGHPIFSQSITQTLKGQVLDSQSNYPLLGANVIIEGSNPLIGTTTDANGQFKLTGVSLGRQTLRITYLGYQEQILPNVLVTSGKEVVLQIKLIEQVVTGAEVVIRGNKDKTVTNNELTTVSARSFNPEETGRYAGSRNDPARMAANFAGVSATNDSRNDIIVRGNSPNGLLWRLEGINIPNPNHYGSLGATGGPVSMLNYNLLSRSDFMTAAFPAEYGNAIAGVFDLQLRNGNNEKREYLGQIGFNGFELGVEGPFAKNKKASYLANYRYSTLGVFQSLGMKFGTGSATPQYQDLNFKIDIPTSKAGRFSIFGMGGISSIDLLGSDVDTTSSTDIFGDENQNGYSRNRTGVAGLSHLYYFNSTLYTKLSLGASSAFVQYFVDSLNQSDRTPIRQQNQEYTQNKYSVNFLLSKKFNAQNTLQAGIIADLYDFKLLTQIFISQQGLVPIRNSKGHTTLSQVYTHWQHKFSNQLTLNTGLNFLHLELNNSTALEPRLGLKYELSTGKVFNFGYGYHSQMQPLLAYFKARPQADGLIITPNKNLGFTRSQHFALGYDQKLGNDMRIKAEMYYQYITQAPIHSYASSYSILNAGADYNNPDEENLVNQGTGHNYGLELTLEKFYSKGYYFLITASIFDSKYKGSDGISRNTAFNGGYVANLLAGKEFKVGHKNNVINFDWKLTAAGGRYATPLDYERSKLLGKETYRETEAFSMKMKDYFRTDIKLSYRINKAKITHEFAIDLQNITNNKNLFAQRYNVRTNRIMNQYQIGFFPIPQYRILF